MSRSLQDEIVLLDEAVDEFAEAMKERLHEKAAAGFTGWDGETPEEDLCWDMEWDSKRIRERVSCPDDTTVAIDIGNRAMMIFWRRRHECSQEGGR